MENQESIDLNEVSQEAVITIRCLTAIPEELTALIAELESKQSSEL